MLVPQLWLLRSHTVPIFYSFNNTFQHWKNLDWNCAANVLSSTIHDHQTETNLSGKTQMNEIGKRSLKYTSRVNISHLCFLKSFHLKTNTDSVHRFLFFFQTMKVHVQRRILYKFSTTNFQYCRKHNRRNKFLWKSTKRFYNRGEDIIVISCFIN